MAADTTTRTRAEDVQLWVDLDGLGLFLGNLLCDAEDLSLSERLEWLIVKDGESRLGSDDLCESLWKGCDEDDPEWLRAGARAGLVAAQLFAFVASEEGRRVCEKWATRLLEVEMKLLAAADNA